MGAFKYNHCVGSSDASKNKWCRYGNLNTTIVSVQDTPSNGVEAGMFDLNTTIVSVQAGVPHRHERQ